MVKLTEFTSETPEFNLELNESHILRGVINSIDFSRDGELVVAACADMISAYNIMTNGNPSMIECQEKGASHVQFTHDKNKVLHLSYKDQIVIRLYDIEAQKYVCDYYSNKENNDSLCISPVPFHFATYTDRNKIKMWDLRIPTSHTTFNTNGRGVVACHPDGLWIAGCNDFGVHMYDIRHTTHGAEMAYAKRYVFNVFSCMKFSTNGQKLAIASNDFVDLIDTQTIGPIRTYTGFSTDPRIVIETSFNHNSTLLFTGSSNGDTFLYDVNSSKCVHKLQHKENFFPIHCVKQNPQYMAVCTSRGNKLDFWTPNEIFFNHLNGPKHKVTKTNQMHLTEEAALSPREVSPKKAVTTQEVLTTFAPMLEAVILTANSSTEPITSNTIESPTSASSAATVYTPIYSSDTPTEPLTQEPSNTSLDY